MTQITKAATKTIDLTVDEAILIDEALTFLIEQSVALRAYGIVRDILYASEEMRAIRRRVVQLTE